MRLPKMQFKGKVPITVEITEGLNEGGMPNVISRFEGYCIFDESAKTRYGGDKIVITLSGLAIIDGDIAPESKTISGNAHVNGVEMKINAARRIRNFDGTVHHTELELI